jgi:zinc transporter
MNPDAEPEDMVSIRIWLQEQRMITIRQRRILAAQDVKSTLQAGKGPSSLIYVLIDIITQLADRIADFVNQMESRMDQYETAIGLQNPIELRSQISELRRQSAVVRRFLAPQRDALDTLQQPSNKSFSDSHRYAIREETDRMIRSVEDLDLVRERALVAQEELINLAAQEQNNRMYVLSIIAAVFLPITFISGVFGMNVAGLPGTNTPTAFLIVCIAMIALSIGTLLWLRFKGWF